MRHAAVAAPTRRSWYCFMKDLNIMKPSMHAAPIAALRDSLQDRGTSQQEAAGGCKVLVATAVLALLL